MSFHQAAERAVRHEWEGMAAVARLDGCLGCHGAYADPCDEGMGLRYMLTMRRVLGLGHPSRRCLSEEHESLNCPALAPSHVDSLPCSPERSSWERAHRPLA